MKIWEIYVFCVSVVSTSTLLPPCLLSFLSLSVSFFSMRVIQCVFSTSSKRADSLIKHYIAYYSHGNRLFCKSHIMDFRLMNELLRKRAWKRVEEVFFCFWFAIFDSSLIKESLCCTTHRLYATICLCEQMLFRSFSFVSLSPMSSIISFDQLPIFCRVFLFSTFFLFAPLPSIVFFSANRKSQR